jgi:hypothetical protein
MSLTSAGKLIYQPRMPFIPLHNRAQRWAFVVAHRRAGKTVSLVNDLLIGAIEERRDRPQFAYIAPTYAQAKRTAWEYLKTYARPIMRGQPNETELRVDLINNGRIFLAGADNPESLRGLYLDGAVLDEHAQSRPSVWTQIIRPALADRNGWAVVSGTPWGKNHFYELYRHALERPDEWFMMVLRASESGIISAHELAEMRALMDEDEYLQEMECSFDATAKGMILSRYVEQAEADGRISDDVEYDPEQPVFVNSDIGFRDAAAWWFWQPLPNNRFNIIDFDQASGLDAEDWIDRLSEKFNSFGRVWLPHDARAKTFATRRSAMEQFMAAGHRVGIVPRVSTHHRVNAARFMVQHCQFHKTRCKEGLDALRNWKYKFDDVRRVFSLEPDHDGNSHAGDAWSYFSLVSRPDVARATVSKDGPAQQPSPALAQFTLDQLFTDRDAAAAASEWR